MAGAFDVARQAVVLVAGDKSGESETLHISQDGVSRIETRSDFLLSTLRSYVEAMGGKLRLIAEFPDRRPVTISGLNILGTAEKPKRRGRKRADEDAPA